MAFGRYTLIGGAATAVHYGALLAHVEVAQIAPAWAAAAGAVASAAVAHLGNRRFTVANSSAPCLALLLSYRFKCPWSLD